VLANTWHKKVEKLNLSDLKIYCISLSDSQARRQEILEMKNKFGLSLEFVDAIDGRSCSKEEIQASTERESDGTA
jgi:GR25 family glycosyltransferase involved in LPS biosynthesis